MVVPRPSQVGCATLKLVALVSRVGMNGLLSGVAALGPGEGRGARAGLALRPRVGDAGNLVEVDRIDIAERGDLLDRTGRDPGAEVADRVTGLDDLAAEGLDLLGHSRAVVPGRRHDDRDGGLAVTDRCVQPLDVLLTQLGRRTRRALGLATFGAGGAAAFAAPAAGSAAAAMTAAAAAKVTSGREMRAMGGLSSSGQRGG